LLRQYVFFNFAHHYMLNRHIDADFQVTDEVMQQFVASYPSKKFQAPKPTLCDAGLGQGPISRLNFYLPSFGQDEGMKSMPKRSAVPKALEFLPEASNWPENARRLSAQKQSSGTTP